MDSDEDGQQHGKEGLKKTKRQMKTPYQLETLEQAYANDTYPSEAIRGDLSKKLGLTDRQLQMWFCHRRLKDKKEAQGLPVTKPRPLKPRASAPAPAPTVKRSMVESSQDEEADPVSEPVSRSGGSRSGSGSGSGGSGSGSGAGSGSSQFNNGAEMPPVASGGYYESPSAMLVRRVVDCVEAQLGEPLRVDGPILGADFDVLPPGAFGTPIVTAEHRDQYRNSYEKKSYGSYDRRHINPSSGSLHHDHDELKIRSDTYGHIAQTYTYESPIVASGGKTVSSIPGNGHLPREYGVEGISASASVLPQQGRQGQMHSPSPSDAMMTKSEEIIHIERKRKSDEARMERDSQVHEKRIKKELEKQDHQKRKMEEQMKKEMEKQDRDKRKEELRLMREQQRKEERYQREEKREMERREKFMQKEILRAERKKQKDDIRRERELVRQKAAMERAAARRIAKESLELIEDERLELMDLAASSKGLPSIVSLDYEALQDLESFRDSLCKFPPESVKLKKPFGIHPWADSEENVGNLLMVWKFCITFADLLGLWPFTLDEFIQAFHDYDSRLLGEIHIALLKVIIKDIEDVVRTPTGGPGTNQYSVFNPEGGHPQIVEGAYVWGFDIRSWQKHLNPLTWPEILRQFALSAGFGPELKKKDTERGNTNENDETKGCEDIVSTLRNGSAAKSAANTMREKGVSLQKKSRHRLTPGTVKFAAYHVLALEGSKGLNVLDLAEKIQKSGLRDLSTSKTPEASISVALSRDPVLFERIAPSTYNVRPAYRKNPADADTIIAEARDKIQKFVNGVLTGQNAEDEVDEDSDCDVGAEVDDLATPSEANKIIEVGNEVGTSTGNGKESITAEIPVQKEFVSDGASKSDLEGEIDESRSGQPWVQGLTEGEYSELSVEERLNALVVLVGIANEGNSIRVILEDRLDAACALKKQMWAEAQLDKRRLREDVVTKFGESGYGASAEGSQSPLAMGNNRNGDASPGNVAKEEPAFGMGNIHNQMDSIQQNGSTAERSRMQMKAFIGHRAEEMYVYRSLPLGSDRRRNRYWLFVASPSSHDPGSGRIFVESPEGRWMLIDTEESFDALLTSLDMRGVRESHLHIMLQKIEGPFRDRIRSNLSRGLATGDDTVKSKSEFAESRSSPGGSTCAESPSSSVCATNSDLLEPSSTFKIEFGRSEMERENSLKRYQDLQVWLWKECFSSAVLRTMSNGKNRCTPLLGVCSLCLDLFLAMEGHCCSPNISSNVDSRKLCLDHTYSYKDEVNVELMGKGTSKSSQQPLRIRLIKVLLNSLEASVPNDALQSSWTEDLREAWASILLKSSSTDDLLQVLTQFEGAIKRDSLLSSFETTEELLTYCASVKKLSFETRSGSINQLPWIPQTTAAVALRLLDLDASLTFGEEQKPDEEQKPNEEQKPEIQEEKKVENVIQKLPSKYANTGSGQKVKNNTGSGQKVQNNRGSGQKVQTLEVNGDNKRRKEKALEVNGDNKRPRGPACPRGKVLKEPPVPVSEAGRQISKQGTLTQALMLQGERSYGQKHSRGRRTVRKRRTTEKSTPEVKIPEIAGGLRLAAGIARHASAMMVEKPVSPAFKEVEENSSSSDDGDDSDENAPETTYNYGEWGSGFAVTPCRTNSELVDMSEEEEDESEDDNAVEDNYTTARHMQVDDYEYDRNVDRQRVVEEEEEEEASDSASGDYSD